MTDPDDTPREPAPADSMFPFGDFEVETETLPDGRRVHYYRWPADEPDTADV